MSSVEHRVRHLIVPITKGSNMQSEVFESHRPLLFSIAYRMLGSVMEAEDMVQETYLRFQRLGDQEIQSPKAYLSKIITHLCLDHLKSAKVQREQYIGTWLPEPLLTGESTHAMINRNETISVAFLVLLENLTPMERAIFVLRDVFDYHYAEIARIVDKSEANCRRYYRHAKQYLMERRPRFEPSTEAQKKLTEQFLEALASGDVEGLTRLLAQDVTLYGDGGGKAKAIKKPLFGREAVMRLLIGSSKLFNAMDVQIEIAEVNGKPALLFSADGRVQLVMNLMVVDNRITAIYNVLNPDKLGHMQVN